MHTFHLPCTYNLKVIFYLRFNHIMKTTFRIFLLNEFYIAKPYHLRQRYWIIQYTDTHYSYYSSIYFQNAVPYFLTNTFSWKKKKTRIFIFHWNISFPICDEVGILYNVIVYKMLLFENCRHLYRITEWTTTDLRTLIKSTVFRVCNFVSQVLLWVDPINNVDFGSQVTLQIDWKTELRTIRLIFFIGSGSWNNVSNLILYKIILI